MKGPGLKKISHLRHASDKLSQIPLTHDIPSSAFSCLIIPFRASSCQGVSTYFRNSSFSGPKSHDSQRRDRILRIFLCPRSVNSIHLWGVILTKLYRKPEEERTKATGENKRNSSGDGAPKLQISVFCRSRTCPDFSKDLSAQLGREK